MLQLTMGAVRRSVLVLTDECFEATGKFRERGSKTRPTRRLLKPIVCELGGAGSGLFVVVPPGYITDGYSMPGRLLQVFQPRSAKWFLPSLLHDWLYDGGLLPRDMCDRILLEAMRELGVEWWQRMFVYLGVRIGGWGGYGAPLPENLELVLAERRAGLSERFTAYLQEKP